MLKRLYIDNVLSLVNFELHPAPIAGVVGPNGGGKSNLDRTIGALLQLLQTGSKTSDAFPSWYLTRWQSRPTQRIELDVSTKSGEYSYVLEIDHSSATPSIKTETLRSDGQLLYQLDNNEVSLFGDPPNSEPQIRFPFAGVRSFLPQIEPRPDNTRTMDFLKWINGVWRFSLMPREIDVISEQENFALAQNARNFVSWYRHILQERPAVRSQLLDDLSPVIPGLQEIALSSAGINGKFLQLSCSVNGTTYPLNLHEISDGQRCLLILYAIVRTLADHASLLVFDEPDNFVAAAEIQPWLSELRECVSASQRGTLLVISHHPEVIDYLAPDQLLHIRREADGPTRASALKVSLDDGLKSSEVLRLGLADE